jgi:DNA-binding transcriptional MerR regulator
MQFSPKKLYYKIGEVCEIVGVEAHVLRFWETEFPALSPPKTKSGQRIYRPKDIEVSLRIKSLLYDEGFTIAGARKQLAAEKNVAKASPAVQEPPQEASPEPPVARPATDRLNKVRTELQNILTLLDRE